LSYYRSYLRISKEESSPRARNRVNNGTNTEEKKIERTIIISTMGPIRIEKSAKKYN